MMQNTRIWHWRWVSLLLGLLMVSACGTVKLTPGTSTVTKPLKLYNPGRNELHPDLVVYHSSQDESTLYFRLLISELLFNQANPETTDQSRVRVSYELYSSYSDQILDQRGSQEFIIKKEDEMDSFTGSVKIPTEEGKSYLLETVITDDIRQISSRQMILVDRFNPKSQQNFLLLTYPGNQVVFERFFYSNEAFRIVTQHPPGADVRIAWFKPFAALPPPPFVSIESTDGQVEPDSVWTIPNNGRNIFRLENEGVYILYPDPDDLRGVYVTNFGRLHPQVQTAANMIPPLRYLLSDDAYDLLEQAADPKVAVDEFWLERGGSFSAARELIRVYYNRVVFANLYFSADRQGWLTDRGMIYILMGPPDQVNKSESGESWVYQRTGSNQKYTFAFNLAPDPIMGYEFKLERSEDHRVPWNRSLQSWQDGRIFSLQ